MVNGIAKHLEVSVVLVFNFGQNEFPFFFICFFTLFPLFYFAHVIDIPHRKNQAWEAEYFSDFNPVHKLCLSLGENKGVGGVSVV